MNIMMESVVNRRQIFEYCYGISGEQEECYVNIMMESVVNRRKIFEYCDGISGE